MRGEDDKITGTSRATTVVVCALATLLAASGCETESAPPAAGDSAEVGAKARTAGPSVTDPAPAVTAMLDSSAASWNEGDLEAFLDDYATGSELTFVGSSGLFRGIDQVRGRYRRTYWSPGAVRDSLRFEEVEVRPLGEDHALALGRYVLHRPAEEDSVTATGRFSLVLERREEGWKIIHDHSS